MEKISKLIICLVFVSSFKKSDGGIVKRVLGVNRTGRGNLLPFKNGNNNFQQQNDYIDYDAGVDTNYENIQQNEYSESNGIFNPDVRNVVPSRPNIIGYNNQNIQDQRLNYKTDQRANSDQSINFKGNNKNPSLPRPLGSMDLYNTGNVRKANTEIMRDGVDIISDRFGEDPSSVVDVKDDVKEDEEKSDVQDHKLLKPLTKTKLFFPVQPVRSEGPRSRKKDVVFYIE